MMALDSYIEFHDSRITRLGASRAALSDLHGYFEYTAAASPPFVCYTNLPWLHKVSNPSPQYGTGCRCRRKGSTL